MGPANCRGLLKFAMSSIAACALDASIPGRRRRRSVLVFMEPSLGDRYDREEFWGKQLTIAFVRQNTKNFARLSSARGRRILGRISGCTHRRDTAIGARRPPLSGVLQARSGSITPEREEHDLSWDTMLHMKCRQCGLRQSRTGARSRSRSGGAIKTRLRCRQPSPSLSRRRWRC
jgi:hypothetical protein